MDIESSYDRWSQTYDSMVNPTRDLDLQATQRVLQDRSFQRVLEVGCGTGKNSEWLATKCKSLVAVDFSKEMLGIAKKKVLSSNVDWRCLDITEPWEVGDEPFDLILFNLVLEHVENLDPIFDEASQRLLPGGIVLVSELHPYKQYLGSKARFVQEGAVHELKVFTHNVSDFFRSAKQQGWTLFELCEWFDSTSTEVPRLLTLMFSNEHNPF